jgi:hypothetical protein
MATSVGSSVEKTNVMRELQCSDSYNRASSLTREGGLRPCSLLLQSTLCFDLTAFLASYKNEH